MYRNITMAIFIWALLTGIGVFQNIKFSLTADKAGKICHKFFRHRGDIFACVLIAFFAAGMMLSSSDKERITVTGVVAAFLALITLVVWLPLVFGYCVTRKGIIYADGKRESEKFTAREYGGRIGIFAVSDIREPICTVEDTPENREMLAEFWRELPERK